MVSGRHSQRTRLGVGLLAAAAAAAVGSRLLRRYKSADIAPHHEESTRPLPLADMKLVQHGRAPEGSRWSPFAQDGSFNTSWWNRSFPTDSKYSLWSAYLGDAEVVRIQSNKPFDYSGYQPIPNLGYATVGIEYIEVASGHRGNRYGERSLELLAESFPGHRFAACAKEAASYWGDNLGWVRYESHRKQLADWPLFVAPTEWPRG